MQTAKGTISVRLGFTLKTAVQATKYTSLKHHSQSTHLPELLHQKTNHTVATSILNLLIFTYTK